MTTTTTHGTPSGLTTSWLAARLGQQPARIEALRRAGLLVGVPRGDGQRLYPSWQFGRDGQPLPSLPRVVAAARAAGLDDGALHRLVTMRDGMTGDRRLVDALRGGSSEPVLRSIARAAARDAGCSPAGGRSSRRCSPAAVASRLPRELRS